MIQFLHFGTFCKQSVTHTADLGGRHLPYLHFRETLRNDALLVKLQLDPWWVTTDDVEAVTEPEHLDELEHRVEEMVAVGKLLDILEAHGVVEDGAHVTLHLGQHLLLRLDDDLTRRLV